MVPVEFAISLNAEPEERLERGHNVFMIGRGGIELFYF
jgi:hypothetical protein